MMNIHRDFKHTVHKETFIYYNNVTSERVCEFG